MVKVSRVGFAHAQNEPGCSIEKSMFLTGVCLQGDKELPIDILLEKPAADTVYFRLDMESVYFDRLIQIHRGDKSIRVMLPIVLVNMMVMKNSTSITVILLDRQADEVFGVNRRWVLTIT